MTPSLAYLIDQWMLSSLWNGVTTPQKQIFTGFSSSLDFQRMSQSLCSLWASFHFKAVCTEPLGTS